MKWQPSQAELNDHAGMYLEALDKLTELGLNIELAPNEFPKPHQVASMEEWYRYEDERDALMDVDCASQELTSWIPAFCVWFGVTMADGKRFGVAMDKVDGEALPIIHIQPWQDKMPTPW